TRTRLLPALRSRVAKSRPRRRTTASLVLIPCGSSSGMAALISALSAGSFGKAGSSSTSARNWAIATANRTGVREPRVRLRTKAATTSAAPSIGHRRPGRGVRLNRWFTRAVPRSAAFRLVSPLASSRNQVIDSLFAHGDDLAAELVVVRVDPGGDHHLL